jgi:3-oxoacyl-[acyl-carrier-protein] synthase-3
MTAIGIAGIAGIAYALPEATVDVEALAGSGLIESPAAVMRGFGFDRVHVSDRPADELALQALAELLHANDVDPESIDALFYAGAVPESHRVGAATGHLHGFCYPAARLQYECGLTRAAVIGVGQAGCAGLMSAVALAADHLRANPGARRVLCVSADVLPPGAPREIIYNLVSDGACALLVDRGAERNRLLAYRQATKGYYWNAAERNELVAAYFPTARSLVLETLAGLGLAAADVALVVPHNVALRSWQILLPLVGIDGDRLFADNIAAKGHVIAADNFINLKDAADAGRVRPGDRLLLFTFGFGAHWACLVLEA